MITKSKIIVLAVLFALTVLIVVFLAEERIARNRREAARITIRHGVILIGMDSRYTPLEYVRPYGIAPMSFNVALGSEIAARLGLRAMFTASSWDTLFDEFDAGLYDIVLSSVRITPQRQAVYNFSKPYLTNPLVMVTRKGSPAASPMEAAGLNVAFQAGTAADSFMEGLAAGGLGHILHRHDQVAHSFAELEQGRLDAVITDVLIARHFIAPADSPFEIAWKSAEPDLFAVCLKKGNDRLTGAINSVLEELFSDGTMLRLSMDAFRMDVVTQAREAW